MKNEREKEIENVDNQLNRNRKRLFCVEKRRQGSKYQLTDRQQNEYITISRPHDEKKTRGDVYIFVSGFTNSEDIIS